MRFPANFDEANMDLRHHSGKTGSPQRQEFPLLEHLNLQHPLIVLAKLIDWNAIDQIAYEAMGPKHRRPPLRPRLVAGLLYLQHTFDLSDEEVVWGWVQNPYIWTVAGEQPLFP